LPNYRHRLYDENNQKLDLTLRQLNHDYSDFEISDDILNSADDVDFEQNFVGIDYFCFKRTFHCGSVPALDSDVVYKGVFCVQQSTLIGDSIERADNFNSKHATSTILIVLILLFSIPIQLIFISRYADRISGPIVVMTEITKTYRRMQSNAMRDKVRKEIGEHKMFKDIKE